MPLCPTGDRSAGTERYTGGAGRARGARRFPDSCNHQVGVPTRMVSRGTYRQIAQDVRQRIVDGDLSPGEMLPSEHQLVELYGASRGTVRAALALLSEEGVIESVRGRGRRVVSNEKTINLGAAYERIAADLRRRLRAGEFESDAPLPSEAQLSAEHGVSRNTVRRAVRQLVEEGLVVVRHGAGAFPVTATMPRTKSER